MKTAFRLLALLVGLCLAGNARAQSPVVNVGQYRPITATNRGFQLESVRTLPHLQYASAFDFDYSRLPLLVDPGSGQYQSLLEHVTRGDILLAAGLFNRFEASLGLPFVAFQTGQNSSRLKVPAPVAMGDPRLALRARVWQLPQMKEVSFGAGIVMTIPIGVRVPLVNDAVFMAEPRAVAEYRRREWLAAVRVGLRFRPARDFFGTAIRNQLTFAMGGQYAIERATVFITEITGGTPADGQVFQKDLSPVELTMGIRQQIGKLAIGLGAGPGLVSGYGSPSYRLLISIGWLNQGMDSDSDGVMDENDICPYEPEDRDGFEDRDGCPDPDNDKDGVLDAADKCPDQPETKNGFQDEDGCPDTSPTGATPGEVAKVDSDGDGIIDDEDDCPNEPEDMDKFEDDDGCPDPDNDKDGVLDAADKCPDKPETINGNTDDDGCPDAGEVQVLLKDKEVETLLPIFFDTDRARVRTQFHSLLKQVAQVLRGHPEVGRCAIEGHTDGTGPAKWNKELSLKRAENVLEFLIAEGIDRARLSVVGQGQAMPWADNATEEGRAQNRRVIFHIEGIDAVAKGKPPSKSRRAGGIPRFRLLQTDDARTSPGPMPPLPGSLRDLIRLPATPPQK